MAAANKIASISSGTLQSSGEESTKSTVSKKSDDSGAQDENKQGQEREGATPIDLECLIQEERITKILNEALYKIKLAVALPILQRRYKFLSKIMSPNNLADVIFIYEQYENPLFSASLLNMAALDDIKAGDLTLTHRLNPELGHLMQILSSYPALENEVQKIIDQMKAESAAGKYAEPKPVLEYLFGFERFRELIIEKMQTTAPDELSHKIFLKKKKASNDKHIEEIKKVTTILREEQEAFERAMKDKAEEIASLEKELDTLNVVSEARLKKQVLDSNRRMAVMSRHHQVKHEMLKEEEVETREGYHNLLHSHLVEEKAQRARRFKVQTQLLSWLNKYDTEMTDKQYENDVLREKYDSEVAKCEELTNRLAEQDVQYLPLMKEREDEYHAEMLRKQKDFAVEHAARVIQSAWRQVLANRAEKRKLRKQWKAIKKERDRLQKIADLKELKERKQREKEEKAAKKAEKKKK